MVREGVRGVSGEGGGAGRIGRRGREGQSSASGGMRVCACDACMHTRPVQMWPQFPAKHMRTHSLLKPLAAAVSGVSEEPEQHVRDRAFDQHSLLVTGGVGE